MTRAPAGPVRRRTPTSSPREVAVVGAGIAGLACARGLAAAGWPVTVFDKGRAPGGRIATRRHDGRQFDHGAQYFTVRDPGFATAVAGWRAGGSVDVWTGRVVTLGCSEGAEAAASDRFVGVPGMSAICRHLGAGIDVVAETEIAAAAVAPGPAPCRWTLASRDGRRFGGFDRLVVAVPAPQAVALLSASPALAGAAATAVYAPCWAMMLAFTAPPPVSFAAASVDSGPLAWIARDGSKPGRGDAETWVAHASADWSAIHLEQPPEQVAALLVAAFAAAVGPGAAAPTVAIAHRWRYALVTRALGEPCLFDPETGLGGCGDWCLGGRVEAAWLSGTAMARRLVEADVAVAR